MSDTFHQLLHPSNRRRCRKIDQIIFHNEDDEDDTEEAYDQDIMELFTYDLDVDTDWRTRKGKQGEVEGSSDNEESVTGTRRDRTVGPPPTRQAGSLLKKTRRLSMRSFDGKGQGSDELRSGSVSVSSEAGFPTLAAAKAVSASDKAGSTFFELDKLEDTVGTNELVLPTGPSLYSANVWLQADMRRVRNKYSPQFFTTFNSGLQRYYSKDWVGARQCFETVLERFDDGPSKYFLEEMKKDNWKPPPDFQGYGKA
jgi:hypothetical protein